MITVHWYDLVSWAVTIISVTLFIVERRRNDRINHYMALQGIMRTCDKWAGYYATTYSALDQEPEKQVTRESQLQLLRISYTAMAALMDQILGSMKALEPNTEMPFNAAKFMAQSQFAPPTMPPPVNPHQ